MIDQQLLALIDRCVENRSAHVVDVLLRGHRRRPVLEIFVDTVVGVTTDLCAEISRDVSHELAHHQFLPTDHSIIVSSPGIERPLKFPWQFKKHIGRTLRVKVRSWEGVQELQGKLSALDEAGMTLVAEGGAVDSHLGSGTHVRFDAIEEALVKAPW